VCRYTALNRSVWEQVETLVYFFLFPVLLFQSIVKSAAGCAHAASGLMGAGWALGLTGIALAYALPHVPLLKRWIDRRDHAASAQVAISLQLLHRLGDCRAAGRAARCCN
jgi:malonate transporter